MASSSNRYVIHDGDADVSSISKKDLVSNVYKNGHWGSYRHIQLNQRESITFSACQKKSAITLNI